MWPDEEGLEDALSDPSENCQFSGGWARDEQGSHEGRTQEIVPSRLEDEVVKHDGDRDAHEGGLGAGGGLREEWEMMTPDEKVCKRVRETCYMFISSCLCVAMSSCTLTGHKLFEECTDRVFPVICVQMLLKSSKTNHTRTSQYVNACFFSHLPAAAVSKC